MPNEVNFFLSFTLQFDLFGDKTQTYLSWKHCCNNFPFHSSSQVELLQKAECHAQSPEQIRHAVQRILEDNPDLIEAYFLDFLNCLRAREYCGAMQAIHKWLVIRYVRKGTDLPRVKISSKSIYLSYSV